MLHDVSKTIFFIYNTELWTMLYLLWIIVRTLCIFVGSLYKILYKIKHTLNFDIFYINICLQKNCCLDHPIIEKEWVIPNVNLMFLQETYKLNIKIASLMLERSNLMNPKSPHISKQFLTAMTFCQFLFGMKGSYHTSMRDKPTYVCAKNFSSFF